MGVNVTDNSVVRVRLDKTDDSGTQQTLQTRGRSTGAGVEQLGGQKQGVPKVASYGLSVHAPKGSHGLALVQNDNPDQALILGVEHPEARPKNLAEGEVKLYDNLGQFVFLMREMIHLLTPLKALLESEAEFRIRSNGGNVIVESPGGIVHLNPP